MNQTPIHDAHNPDLLQIVPKTSARLIEIGCSSGALAREFKKINPTCHYLGIDIDPAYAESARRYCDETLAADIETMDNDFFDAHKDRDCWIFGDSLEHLRNPWDTLDAIRRVIPAHGSVAVCIPNAQHWSVQARLNIGQFRYEDDGLMDRTHLRWFTRQTMLEMFTQCGFRIAEGFPRVFPEPNRDRYLNAIGEMARISGLDPAIAIKDAMALQFVLRAVPA